jgi:hypothetical protein
MWTVQVETSVSVPGSVERSIVAPIRCEGSACEEVGVTASRAVWTVLVPFCVVLAISQFIRNKPS